MIGVALEQLTPALKLDADWIGLLGAGTLAGLFVGTSLFGYISDKVGRRKMFLIDIIAIGVISVATMFVSSPVELLVMRVLIGIVIGADYPIATSMITEFSSTRQRAFSISFIAAMWYVGATCADLVGYWLYDVEGGWRWMLGSAAIPCLLILIGRFELPESPRWLLRKGRVKECEEMMIKLFGEPVAFDEEQPQQTRFRDLFNRRHFPFVLFVAAIWTCQVIPMFAIYTFGPQIVGLLGLGVGKNAALGNVVISLFFMLGCIPPMLWLNTAGRRPLLIGSFAMMTLALAVLLGRYVTRPALRFVARSGLREVFSAVALFLVFGFGLLLEEVGLSMAMGAFLAGVLLASSEYRHALESDIEPFKGLLLGLFFIGVGMSIDFGTLLENPLRIVILLLGFLIIKIAMLWLIARPLQVPNKQRRWFAVLLGQGSEFAFVVFGAAQMANVLEPEWAKSLTLAVALSMAATPILLVILNRLEQSSTEEAREADEIDEEQPRVIIAGFGRFGQITGRLLLSSGVKMVVLDHDPDHIETLRKFGMKVFYGDATRMDLLESAGAAKAEVLINAIDDPQTNLQLTEMVKEHFPHLQIIARARDVDHYIRLRQAGVEKPERETFEGALKTGRLALESLGLGPYEARERADVFRRFNIQMVEEMAMVENDTKARAAVYKRTSAMLSEIITEDREHLSLIQRHGWQGTEEGKHTGNMADEPETKPSS
ncbi:glutathione-regulated potassium-efflux system protein KefC [Escherichia coli]|nr:glutathione-regulated potassium-efflux system protein KefC [Escherichia coli]